MSKRAAEQDTNPSKKAFKDTAPVQDCFSVNLSDQAQRDKLKTDIAESSPYKHGVICPLINDDLLRRVRKEIMSEIHFTKKETDIYKVHQTGDLANLTGLDPEELNRLSSLNELRNALYSQEFRDYLSHVTGSGPLSGVKKDLSINCYHKSCHLLNHDDVIGSRRVSYILYLTDPDEPWQSKWGGALRLYPTHRPNIPESDWTLALPPSWNQLSFFTVQPGRSFHDVEEVYEDKARLSISGWFHIPQEGEPGYVKGEQEETEALSSLKQLESQKLQAYDYPKRVHKDLVVDDETEKLSSEDIEYLGKYLNPKLLEKDTLSKLNEKFCEESAIEIHEFLNNEYAKAVNGAIDVDDLAKVPGHSSEIPSPWQLARPPHKARYLYIDGTEDKAEPTKTVAAHSKMEEVRQLFQHKSFAHWLRKLSSMAPKSSFAVARRFRPGYDFTLATSSEGDARLEGTLCLTPSKGWAEGEVGGYELTMAVDEDSKADPAVYGAQKDEEDDPVLLTSQADWNVFSLIVRDEGILRFVKYVSKNATGSRWDVFGEWGVNYDDDEDEDKEDDNDNDE
uniref:uS12 prolyl 3,4-dihydroxylase n=1 Tax=Blastobotrys adeninivorans TaxID=409370 RepID=A0A060SZX3_BLAAD